MIKIPIPIKMKAFSYIEISIYSRAGFFIYLFKDFLQNMCIKMQVFYYNGNDKTFFEEMIFPLLKGNICGNAPFIPRFHQIP